MTDSFLEARGLKPTKVQHSGPINAKRLVEAYNCHVFPLSLGSKIPLSDTNGVLDAELSADKITGNYGVAMGSSNLVALDLDDYVADHQVEEFLTEFGVQPTFTVLTGSGGRSMWFRAPGAGSEILRPKTNLLGYKGVDIRANESYALGPGNILHESNIKKGAPGNGVYTFDKTSPTEFTQFPLLLLAAIGREVKEKESSRKVVATSVTDGYSEMDDRTKARVAKYSADALTRVMDEFDEMQSWPEGYSDGRGGWENGVLERTAALASLALADWSPVTPEDVVEQLELHLPHDGSFTIAQGVSKFERALDNVQPRVFPFEPDDNEWFDDQPYVESRPFVEAPAGSSASGEWPQYEQNDFGNAQRISHWANGGLYWLRDEKIWVKYNMNRWERDEDAGENAAMRALNVAFNSEAHNYSEDPVGEEKKSPREKFELWVMNQKWSGRYASMAKAAQINGHLNKFAHDFDQDPYLLGVGNGVLNLVTGELTQSSPELMVSKGTDVKYDPNAKAPLFEKYLESSMPDPEMRDYLQAIMGYSATNSTVEQVFFIHWGPATNNGKSVLMGLMRKLLGEHASSASSKALIKSKNDKHSVEIADLAGPRMLQMSETEEGARLEEATIKQVTGDDEIAARKIAQSNQNWKIEGKIHIVTNYLPHITASPSNRRRTHLIKWPVEIVNADLDLRKKIIATELPGVLNWLVEGAKMWHQTLYDSPAGGRPTGLPRPVTAMADLDEYFGEEDELGQWIQECTDEENKEGWSKAGVLWEDYRIWNFKRNGKPMSITTFGRKLIEKKVGKERRRDGQYYNVDLKAERKITRDAWSGL